MHLTNELLTPLLIGDFKANGIFFFNLILLAINLSLYVYLIWRCPKLIYSLLFLFGSGYILFYQLPTVIFSHLLSNSLTFSSKFFVTTFVVPLLLAVLMLFGGWMKTKEKRELNYVAFNSQLLIKLSAGMLLLLLILYCIYFFFLGVECSPAYVSIFDPQLSSLAREIAGKLTNYSFLPYVKGLVVNVVTPIAISLLALISIVLLERRKFVFSLVILFFLVLAVAALLAFGIKGVLFPSLITVLIVVFVALPGRVLLKLGLNSLILLLFVSLMLCLELSKDIFQHAHVHYSPAQCAIRFHSCSKVKSLLESLLLREDGLGISNVTSLKLLNELNCKCFSNCVDDKVKDNHPMSLPAIVTHRTPPVTNNALVRTSSSYIFGRAVVYLRAIFYRAIIVPFQVSTWHFLYAEQYPNPGMKVVSVYRHLMHIKFNIFEDVYQAFGSVYSLGDKTSTSTSPTSFSMFYPAYLGWVGTLFAVFIVFFIDFMLYLLALCLDGVTRPIYLGLLVNLTLQLLVSDYTTVLFSHGGLWAFLMLLLVSSIIKANRSHR